MSEFTNICIPGPYERCTDCGACMVWDDLRKDAPRWVCPACVVRQLDEKDAEIERLKASRDLAAMEVHKLGSEIAVLKNEPHVLGTLQRLDRAHAKIAGMEMQRKADKAEIERLQLLATLLFVRIALTGTALRKLRHPVADHLYRHVDAIADVREQFPEIDDMVFSDYGDLEVLMERINLTKTAGGQEGAGDG